MKEYSKKNIDRIRADDVVYDLFYMLARLGLYREHRGLFDWKLNSVRDLYITLYIES